MSRPRIQSYVPRPIQKRLRAYAAAQGASESAVVQAALQEYLDRDVKDSVLLMRRLDRLARAVVRLQRDMDVHAEAFAVFVQLWFAFTPDLSDAEHDPATRSGLARYRQFADHVAARFAGGARLVHDVVKEDPAADLAEFAAAGAKSAATAAETPERTP